LEERNPIGNAKYEVVCDQCTFMEETSYLWTVKECKEMDATGTCSEAKVDTSSLRNYKLTIKKNEANANKIIRLDVTGIFF
jgi:hypothetical protein